MGRLFEYQGKSFLEDGGIVVPTGGSASVAKEAYEIANRRGEISPRQLSPGSAGTGEDYEVVKVGSYGID